jgi:hypothetical protein
MKAINPPLVIDTLRHNDSAKQLPLEFFERLPTTILIQVENKLPLAGKAIEQRNTIALTIEQGEVTEKRAALNQRFNSLVVCNNNDKRENQPGG